MEEPRVGSVVDIQSKSVVPVPAAHQHQQLAAINSSGGGGGGGGLLQRFIRTKYRFVDLSARNARDQVTHPETGLFARAGHRVWLSTRAPLLKLATVGLAVHATNRCHVWGTAEQTADWWQPLWQRWDLQTVLTAAAKQSVMHAADVVRRLPQTLGELKSKSGVDVDRLMPTLLAMRNRVQTVATEYYAN